MRSLPVLLAVGLTALLGFACGGGEPSLPRHAFLIVLDTVRADHLSCYGYERETTPNLDRMASQGTRFDRAFAQAPWTLPSVASVLSGQPPHVHGGDMDPQGIYPVPPNLPLLSERFQLAGFRTGGFFNVLFLGPYSGLNRGYDTYDYHETDPTNRGSRNAAATVDAVLAWAKQNRNERLFAVVHFFDAHLTYEPPPPYDTLYPGGTEPMPLEFGHASHMVAMREGKLAVDADRQKTLVARYDGELRYTDEQIGRLRAGLEQLGLWDDAVVVVVADHGEEFWDHGGFEHGHTHYRELLHVPLIVHGPGFTGGGVNEDMVSHLDIAPTLLQALQLPMPDNLPGHVLGSGPDSYVMSEGSLYAGDLISLRTPRGILILDRSGPRREFYAADDPGETRNLWDERAATLADLESLLLTIPRRPTAPTQAWEPTPEQRERLRSLGYLR